MSNFENDSVVSVLFELIYQSYFCGAELSAHFVDDNSVAELELSKRLLKATVLILKIF